MTARADDISFEVFLLFLLVVGFLATIFYGLVQSTDCAAKGGALVRAGGIGNSYACVATLK